MDGRMSMILARLVKEKADRNVLIGKIDELEEINKRYENEIKIIKESEVRNKEKIRDLECRITRCEEKRREGDVVEEERNMQQRGWEGGIEANISREVEGDGRKTEQAKDSKNKKTRIKRKKGKEG